MEILGLIETLESMICDSYKIPFTGKTLIDEAEILSLIDKMRLVLQSGESVLKTRSKQREQDGPALPAAKHEELKNSSGDYGDPQAKAVEIVQQAYQVAKEIRQGADRYADEVLSKLEASADRVIRVVRNGRQRLSKSVGTEHSLSNITKDIQPGDEDVLIKLSSSIQRRDVDQSGLNA